jgi:branched-chain amino acid transport system ATP-binding protein
LQVEGLRRNFGGIQALVDMSFETRRGEVFGVIGPNGAGKTTLFNVIAGSVSPSSGRVRFDGADITALPSERVARLGIARTFQATNIFTRETVAENLRRGALLSKIFSPAAFVRQCCFAAPGADARRPGDIADFVGLSNCLDQRADTLSYGLQKLLGVGMAMMMQPQLMLMDEPAAGLNPTEKARMAALIRSLRRIRGIDVIVVEHDMPLIMQACDRILVMSFGKRIALGTPLDIRSDPTVIDAYLGAEYDFA